MAFLQELSKESLPLAGGKGANLGELCRLKLPVPEGFVVTTQAFDIFLQANLLQEIVWRMEQRCDVENTEELLETSRKIKELLQNQSIPKAVQDEILKAYSKLGKPFVAVRSSATAEDLARASFAGQMSSFLNVRGEKELLEAVKKCWMSLFEPRAIFYRRKQGIAKTSMAVIVQRMVDADAAGVMFTLHPATGEDKIIVEAVFGLGETIVAGKANPDQYLVDKRTLELLETKIGEKQLMHVRDPQTGATVEKEVSHEKASKACLTPAQVKELAKYGLLLEKHYKHPQDVEFAVEKGKVYVLQTRNLTTKAKIQRIETEAKPLLQGLGASPGIAQGKVRIVHTLEDLAKVEAGDILVTEMTSPDMVVAMSKARAIVTDRGGANCHAAIVSRELGIPCVVGAGKATQLLKEGEEVTVDAYAGKIYRGRIKIRRVEEKFEEKTRTKIKVNLAFAQQLEEVAKKSDGVGLLRIEHAILTEGKHPFFFIRSGKIQDYEKILEKLLKPIAKSFYPKPVWVRSLDARSDELAHLEGAEKLEEPNPMLGWHGIRYSLQRVELLRAEARVLKKLREEGLTNLCLMLPFLMEPREFKQAKRIVEEIDPGIKIGIMVETPACALQIEEFCKAGIKFASIGSNDLTMLTLGVDRNNEKIANLYSEFHPAVLQQIQRVVETCKRYKIEVSLCGEAGSNPEFAKLLVRWGIDSISVNRDALDRVRKAVWEAEKV